MINKETRKKYAYVYVCMMIGVLGHEAPYVYVDVCVMLIGVLGHDAPNRKEGALGIGRSVTQG